MNETLRTIAFRRSAREFSQKKVSFRTIQKIVKYGQMAPTSGGLQLYTVIFIQNQKLKEELGKVMNVQAHAKAATAWLFICADWHRQKAVFKELKVPYKINKSSRFFLSLVDSCLFMENTLLAAESLGVSSIVVGSPWPCQNKLCKKLNLPKEVWPLFLVCLGYGKGKPFKKPRLPLKAVLAKNAYNKKLSLKKLERYYKETGKKLRQANYFKDGIASLSKHWEYKFGKQSEKKIWSKLKKSLGKCNG